MKRDLTEQHVRAILTREVDGNQLAWATANGMSSAYVSDVVGGRATPGPKILAALGLQKIVRYRQLDTDD
jgi:hypothetical protein